MFAEFRESFSRPGRLEGHEMNAQFKKHCVPKQQKVRGIPAALKFGYKKLKSNQNEPHRRSERNKRRRFYTTDGDYSESGEE